MKEGSVCFTENEILFCVFSMIPGRRVGFPGSQKKCVYSEVEVEVNGSVFLHRLFGTSPLVPFVPLSPLLPFPPDSNRQCAGKWEILTVCALQWIVLHFIELYCNACCSAVWIYFSAFHRRRPLLAICALSASFRRSDTFARRRCTIYAEVISVLRSFPSIGLARGRDRQLDVYFGDNECGLDWL